MKMSSPRSTVSSLAEPVRRIRVPRRAVSLWKPEIVLATALDPATPRPAVTPAGPTLRPEAVRTQLGAARAILDALAGARQSLAAQAADARARAEQATTPSARLSAVAEAYRAEASLDEVLTGTLRQVTALMEERGLR